MKTPTLIPWDQLASNAAARRTALWRHVREWAAQHHATHHNRRTPGHALAALDATARPVRVRMVAVHDHTPREYAEAEADDLWDATAVVWAMVKAMPADAAQLQHVVVELQAAGRWLASFPVHAAAHNEALAELFAVEVVA